MDTLLTSPLARGIAVLVVLATTSLAWFITSRRSGTMRILGTQPTGHPGGPSINLAALGVTAGAAATFVQFSSAVCSPCRQVARVLAALSAEVDDVVHVEVDITQYPDLVREHGIMRTPTVLLVGPSGAVHARSSGPMTADHARTALAELSLRPHRPTLQEHS